MGDIVNLRRARKHKARAAAEAEAAANRVAHGVSKAAREGANKEQKAAERKLDGHKRSDDTD